MNPVDMSLALRLAKACDCSYFVDVPGGITTCPDYAAVGFTEVPKAYTIDAINACYVGTADDAVILTFRGTLPLTFVSREAFLQSLLDWLNDADMLQIPLDGIVGLVHQGFARTLLQLWPLFIDELQQQLAGGKPLYVTGHSKGGAVAFLAASRLVGLQIATPQVFTYAAPRAGNADFAKDYHKNISSSWRFEITDDIVPHLPSTNRTLEILKELDPRFRTLALPTFQSAGLLEFINWSREIVTPDSFWLDLDRSAHLARLILEFQFAQIGDDHRLVTSYMPGLGG